MGTTATEDLKAGVASCARATVSRTPVARQNIKVIVRSIDLWRGRLRIADEPARVNARVYVRRKTVQVRYPRIMMILLSAMMTDFPPPNGKPASAAL